MFGVVTRMPLSVVDLHFAEIEGRNPFEARHVDAQLLGVRTALVVSIDSADPAEMMFRNARVEAIGAELVLAARDAKRFGR